ncbi:MAG: hypothetical protein VR72_20130 [Clostridiaceae bacterium BRH_c20a]|nr:MAG: hypothetical protein VR72_20130 [Clostridiaceae bacterium BRH_c20a]
MTDRELLELLVEKMGNVEKEIDGIKHSISKLDNKIPNMYVDSSVEAMYILRNSVKIDDQIKNLSKQVEANSLDLQVIKKILV